MKSQIRRPLDEQKLRLAVTDAQPSKRSGEQSASIWFDLFLVLTGIAFLTIAGHYFMEAFVRYAF